MSLQVPPLPHEGPSVPWVSAGAGWVCSSFGKARGGGQEGQQKSAPQRAAGQTPPRTPSSPALAGCVPGGQPARGPVQASGPQT